MLQFKPIFLGTADPNSDLAKLKRACNSQKVGVVKWGPGLWALVMVCGCSGSACSEPQLEV